ncbi:hypothetical protein [Pseudomonas gingeri]|uniref:hypothetical protein n=1 Tax=Pseudomonas gingeri TaxID=117681 RepID=UPI0015A4C2B7|nr:hypothetical protein [Pseudomonas gingeri]
MSGIQCGHFLSASTVSFGNWAEQLIFCFCRSFSKERTTVETGISLTVGHYDSRGNYSPTPGPCIPLPSRNTERRVPPPEPYNGDFYSQAKRTIERQIPTSTCHVGLKFIWDNGEGLGCDLPCVLTPASGEPIRTRLDEYSRFVGSIPDGAYQAQMLAEVDTEDLVVRSRAEVQAALEAILEAERAEAAALQAIQDERGVVTNAFHTHLAIGKGALYGAWGLVKSAKEYGDLINPFVTFSNVVVSAWNADVSNGGSWIASFRDNFSQAQHRELIEALGFDPSKITREQLAESYETACFVMEDGPSRDLLARFAVDYVKAQNREEIAEFGGAVVFEIVLIGLLVMYSGGAGLAAKGTVSMRNLALTQRLGSGLKRLGQGLKNARIKKAGRAEGKGAGAQIVRLEWPKEIDPATLYRPDRKLVNDKHGRPVPDAEEPHTQLANRRGRKDEYRQAREWHLNKDGKLEPKRDIDFTDHGRPKEHTSPHQHDFIPNPTGGTPQHGPARPLEYPQ